MCESEWRKATRVYAERFCISADSEDRPSYPVIDIDPHFTRVVSNFRSTDYAAWAAGTTAFPSALYLWRKCVQ